MQLQNAFPNARRLDDRPHGLSFVASFYPCEGLWHRHPNADADCLVVLLRLRSFCSWLL